MLYGVDDKVGDEHMRTLRGEADTDLRSKRGGKRNTMHIGEAVQVLQRRLYAVGQIHRDGLNGGPFFEARQGQHAGDEFLNALIVNQGSLEAAPVLLY
jgi:hypothetical protein